MRDISDSTLSVKREKPGRARAAQPGFPEQAQDGPDDLLCITESLSRCKPAVTAIDRGPSLISPSARCFVFAKLRALSSNPDVRIFRHGLIPQRHRPRRLQAAVGGVVRAFAGQHHVAGLIYGFAGRDGMATAPGESKTEKNDPLHFHPSHAAVLSLVMRAHCAAGVRAA